MILLVLGLGLGRGLGLGLGKQCEDKIVDGKKTTFFNHTLDEKTKELIGDIAPKKIEASDVTTAANLNGRSVWNTAGTFESIGYTAYAKETIEKLLLFFGFTFLFESIGCCYSLYFCDVAIFQ